MSDLGGQRSPQLCEIFTRLSNKPNTRTIFDLIDFLRSKGKYVLSAFQSIDFGEITRREFSLAHGKK